MDIIKKIFGKSKFQTEIEDKTIVRLMEKIHEMRKEMRDLQNDKSLMFYEAMDLIQKRSPEDAQVFWKKYN